MINKFLSPLEMRNLFPLPVCGDDCTANLAAVEFDECAPETHDGRIDYIYLTNRGNGFTDWSDVTEWNTRLDNAAPASDSIITLTVIGSKPIPASEEREISLGRKIVAAKTHQVDIAIDETNAINHEFLRQNECGGQYLMWYGTSDGLMFGGNEGIECSLLLDMEIPESDTELMRYLGKLEWKSKFTEERQVSPLA